METKRQVLGQLILCKGCCCGRTERGMPEVPVERIKQIWKQENLNSTIQLSISGCLGPCDVPNVVLVMTAAENVWLGGVRGDEQYDRLVQWARDCHARGAAIELPESLAVHRLKRFQSAR